MLSPESRVRFGKITLDKLQAYCSQCFAPVEAQWGERAGCWWHQQPQDLNICSRTNWMINYSNGSFDGVITDSELAAVERIEVLAKYRRKYEGFIAQTGSGYSHYDQTPPPAPAKVARVPSGPSWPAGGPTSPRP